MHLAFGNVGEIWGNPGLGTPDIRSLIGFVDRPPRTLDKLIVIVSFSIYSPVRKVSSRLRGAWRVVKEDWIRAMHDGVEQNELSRNGAKRAPTYAGVT